MIEIKLIVQGFSPVAFTGNKPLTSVILKNTKKLRVG